MERIRCRLILKVEQGGGECDGVHGQVQDREVVKIRPDKGNKRQHSGTFTIQAENIIKNRKETSTVRQLVGLYEGWGKEDYRSQTIFKFGSNPENMEESPLKKRRLVSSDQNITLSPKHHSPRTRPRALRQRPPHPLSPMSSPTQSPGPRLSQRRCRRTETHGRSGSTASLSSSVGKIYNPPNTVKFSSKGHPPLKTDKKHPPGSSKSSSSSSPTATPATSSSPPLALHPPPPESRPDRENVSLTPSNIQELPHFAASREDNKSGSISIICQEDQDHSYPQCSNQANQQH